MAKTRTFITMSPTQFVLSSLIVGALAGGINVINSRYEDYRLLPVVVQSENAECVKVINLDNGHAFNCEDVNVVLRRFRTQPIAEGKNEKLSTTNLLGLSKNN